MKKIFVCVGTHTQPFDRLLKAVDELNDNYEVIVQIGYSTYQPRKKRWFRFCTQKEFEEYCKWSDVIISHAGAGSIITALILRKPLVIVPRLKKFGEHTDDHQLELARKMAEEKYAVVCEDEKELKNYIMSAKKTKFHSEVRKLNKRLEDYLELIKK